MVWKGESRRHSLARRGIKTVIDKDTRFDVSKFVAKGYDWMGNVPDSVWYKNPNSEKKEYLFIDEVMYRGVTIEDAIDWLRSDKAFHDNTTKEQMRKSLKEFFEFHDDVFEQDFNFYLDHVIPEFLKTEFMLAGKKKKGMIGSGINKNDKYKDSLYSKLKDRGIPTANHESDLYVKATPESIELTKDIETRTFFRSNIDGELWIDLPFRYDPFWINKERRGGD